MSARPPVVERPWRDKRLYMLMVNIGAFLPMDHETRQQVIELGYRIEDLEQEVADRANAALVERAENVQPDSEDRVSRLQRERDEALTLVSDLREAGQALRDCGYSWDSSMAAADAADAWDELTR